MTFDRDCELCGDVCYQEFYTKKEVNDFIPEFQEFNSSEIEQIMKQKPLRGKILIVKPFRYNDCRCVCNECWKDWNETHQISPTRGEVVKDCRS